MKKTIFLSIVFVGLLLDSFATTLITSVAQVSNSTNLKVDWGETDVNISDPGTSLHKYKLIYKPSGGSATTIDNISSGSRSYTINNLTPGTYEVELIEVIRIQVPPTPFSPPYVDNESSSGVQSASIMSLNAAPVARCSNRTLSVGDGTTVNLWGYQAGEGSTDPNGDPLTFSLYPEGPYGVGNHMIELTVSDPDGLNSKCYFTLTVIDNTPPVVLAKNAVIFIKANGYTELNIEDVDDRSYDNVSWVHKTISKRLFTCEDVGFNSVTLTVTDENGNAASKQVTVQVVDNTEPYIIDKPLTLYADENGVAILSQSIIDTLVYDNCGLQKVVVSKDTFNLANPSDSLTIIATDKSGNVSAKKILVTVLESASKTETQNFIINIANKEAFKSPYSLQNFSLNSTQESDLVNENFGNKISFGPNPSSGIVNFQMPNNFEKIILYKADGQEVPVNIANQNSSFQLNLQDLQNGLYILKLQDSNSNEIIKLMKY
ncbi:Por secretion system C-terminal sorting domain-containing protein [Spirosomataceae bacterium TFI 002]|nr:Por secretion system C-terminal sorting domain-containing protein [Spirosomataceae bacterium TFI 002]